MNQPTKPEPTQAERERAMSLTGALCPNVDDGKHNHRPNDPCEATDCVECVASELAAVRANEHYRPEWEGCKARFIRSLDPNHSDVVEGMKREAVIAAQCDEHDECCPMCAKGWDGEIPCKRRRLLEEQLAKEKNHARN